MAEPKLTPLVPVRPDVGVPLRLLLTGEVVVAGLQRARAAWAGVATRARVAASVASG